MVVAQENIQRVDDYFTADSKSSICTVNYHLGGKLVVHLLVHVFGSDFHASVFLGLASSGHAP